MTVYDDMYALRFESSNIKNRTIVGVAKAAMDIFAEDAGTANHAARLAWAQIAIVNTESEAGRFMWGVLSDSTVRGAGELATDAQIQSALDAVVNDFAT